MNIKVMDWVIRSRKAPGYMPPVFIDWPKSLWDSPNEHNEITDFLEERFDTTLDRDEYYCTLFYLDKVVSHDLLFVYFEHSPQYRERYGTETERNSSTGKRKTMKEPSISMKKLGSTLKGPRSMRI